MKQRYQYRIYPNFQQVRSLTKLFGCCRVVWNDSLALCNSADKLPSNGDLQKTFITQAKKLEQREWLAEVSNIPLQQSIADLGVAWKNYFDSLKGKRKGLKIQRPKFKKRNGKQSARFRKGGFSIKHGKVYLARIGRIKVVWSRELPSGPSSVTIIKDTANRYFASFVVEVNPAVLPDNGQSVGVDLGIADFATLSTGEKVKAPKPLKKHLRKLRSSQRKLSRKKKGSKRRELARRKVARIHAKISDIRKDFLHKLSTRIIRENQTIVLEDLNVSGMMKNRKLSRAISDLGWRSFRTMLEAKSSMYGRDFRVISRWEPTSQRCSCCGQIGGKKELSVREWTCLFCGAVHDRDKNAAINIKVAGGLPETKNGRGGRSKTASNAASSSEASTHQFPKQISLFG
ncbi:RNA-guided endonuclease TnpB family protein [Microcoleus sp. A003_D6]|uniref:RNA-guided endonuclease InsQ/TnpB family protein n=1 Tax=Microcoleus sp. A003_D6 TaxID=3055266 RepID=UPI002FD2F9C3